METLRQLDNLNQMSFLCDEIQKRIPELDYNLLWNKSGELTPKEYRTFLAIMYRKPHYFKDYVMKNLINQSKPLI